MSNDRNELVLTAALKDMMVTNELIKDDTSFTMDTRLGEDLKLDSLDKVELSIIIENHWHIHLPLSAMSANINTVGDIIQLINLTLEQEL